VTITESPSSDLSIQMPGFARGRKKVFSVSPCIFEVRADFLVQGIHRRVRLRSVDEREHILLEQYAYINNSERESAII
jgi:hypothetical protein